MFSSYLLLKNIEDYLNCAFVKFLAIKMIDLIMTFFSEKRKIQRIKVVENYKTPLDLARFYNNGATRKQKRLIDEFLENSPDRYKKEVKDHIDYLASLGTQPSALERKS